jgi:hypothetical protein
MAKKLGKLKKPAAKKFKKGRKLFFLPLIFSPEKPEPEIKELLDRYWKQAWEQLENLEEKLSRVNKVYHELIYDTGDNGVKDMDEMDAGSKQIVKSCLERDAEFLPVEERSLLNEYIDWSRCLSIGLLSRRALEKVEEYYNEVQAKRVEQIARTINETLKGDERGLLVMREGLEVKFPDDIHVFYIAPPALDEVKKLFWKKGYMYGMD